jgi:hypothetical protein
MADEKRCRFVCEAFYLEFGEQSHSAEVKWSTSREWRRLQPSLLQRKTQSVSSFRSETGIDANASLHRIVVAHDNQSYISPEVDFKAEFSAARSGRHFTLQGSISAISNSGIRLANRLAAITEKPLSAGDVQVSDGFFLTHFTLTHRQCRAERFGEVTDASE